MIMLKARGDRIPVKAPAPTPYAFPRGNGGPPPCWPQVHIWSPKGAKMGANWPLIAIVKYIGPQMDWNGPWIADKYVRPPVGEMAVSQIKPMFGNDSSTISRDLILL